MPSSDAQYNHSGCRPCIAVPVIRDGEGGVLNPRAVRQAQQVIVSGVWQIAISAVERLRLEGAPCRIPVALACPLAGPALNPQSGPI